MLYNVKRASAEKRVLTLYNVKAKNTFLAIFHIYVIYLQIFMVLNKNSDWQKKKRKKKLAR